MRIKRPYTCALLNICLQGVTALTRHNEISSEFAFRRSRFIRAAEAMAFTIARDEGIRKLVEGRAGGCYFPDTARKECLYIEVFIAKRVQQHFPEPAKESAYYLDHGLS